MGDVRRSTTARGLGHHHQVTRRQVEPLVRSGRAVCTRCGLSIDPLEPWDLDHTEDRRGYLGLAHRRCNRSAGGVKGNRARGRRVSVEL